MLSMVFKRGIKTLSMGKCIPPCKLSLSPTNYVFSSLKFIITLSSFLYLAPALGVRFFCVCPLCTKCVCKQERRVGKEEREVSF